MLFAFSPFENDVGISGGVGASYKEPVETDAVRRHLDAL
jgi:hypothetical protein